jgi:PilZ domain
MDWRANDRKPVAFQVRVTGFANPELTASGEALDISESGIGVYLPLQFKPGTLVCLDINDSVLYGFVAYSIPERSFFRTGIELVQVLIGSSNSSQLLKAALKEAMPELQMTSPA